MTSLKKIIIEYRKHFFKDALENDYLDFVKWFSNNKTPLTIKLNRDGSTPLHIAAKNNSIMCLKWLLEQGVNVDLEDKSGYTPLHIACENRSKDCVKLLLECGADVDKLNNDLETPLHIAVDSDNKNIVKILIDNGALIDNINIEGETIMKTAKNRYKHTNSNDIIDILKSNS